MLLNSASQKMDRKLEMKRWWINLNTKIKINKRRSCSNLNVLESKRIIYTWAIMHSWKKLNSRSFRYYYVCSAALQGLQHANIAARNIRWILHTLSPLIHIHKYTLNYKPLLLLSSQRIKSATFLSASETWLVNRVINLIGSCFFLCVCVWLVLISWILLIPKISKIHMLYILHLYSNNSISLRVNIRFYLT